MSEAIAQIITTALGPRNPADPINDDDYQNVVTALSKTQINYREVMCCRINDHWGTNLSLSLDPHAPYARKIIPLITILESNSGFHRLHNDLHDVGLDREYKLDCENKLHIYEIIKLFMEIEITH